MSESTKRLSESGKKCTAKRIRKAIKAQLQYIRWDLRYIDAFLEEIQIYRNRTNRAFCTEHGIRISGPALGRPQKDNKANKKQEYMDNNDTIEVEWAFSLEKRRYGLGLITTKLDTTTRSSIALLIIAMNVNRLTVVSYAQILISVFSRYKQRIALQKYMQNKSYEDLEIC